MLFVCIVLLFLPLFSANAFYFHACLCLFHFFICIMHSAFNLFVFPNSMFTSLLFFFFFFCIFLFFTIYNLHFYKYFVWKGYELSGEIALKNNHYYYYCGDSRYLFLWLYFLVPHKTAFPPWSPPSWTRRTYVRDYQHLTVANSALIQLNCKLTLA